MSSAHEQQRRLIRIPVLLNLSGNAMYTVAMAGSGIGFFTWGFDSGMANMFSANADFFLVFPSLKTDSTLLGFVFAILTLGLIFGCLLNSAMGNRWGRRDSIIIAGVGMTAFSLCQTLANNLATLCVSRVLTGVFAGIVLTSSPAYIAEISRTANRPLLLLLEAAGSIGLMASFWTAYAFAPIQTGWGWRGPSAIQTILSVLSAVVLIFAPESPRYLIEMGESDKGLNVLRSIHHTEQSAQVSFNEIQHALETERSMKAVGMKALFANNAQCYRYRSLCVYMINVAAQAGGVAIATYYAGNIFVSVGLTGKQIGLCLGGLGMAACAATFAGAGMALKFGRVRTLIATSFACSLGLSFLAISVANFGRSWAAPLGVFGIFFELSAWSFGFLPIQAAYAAEIAPLQTRQELISTGQIVQSVVNFLIIMVSPKGFEAIGYKYYLPYAIASFVACFGFYFFLPETAGFPLERIDELFVDGRVYMRRSVHDMLDKSHQGSVGGEKNETEFVA